MLVGPTRNSSEKSRYSGIDDRHRRRTYETVLLASSGGQDGGKSLTLLSLYLFAQAEKSSK